MDAGTPLQIELERVQELRRKGATAEAERACLAALKRIPEAPDLVHLLGILASDSGRIDEAFALIQLSVQLRPQSAFFRSNFGALLGKMGRHRAAASEFAEAVRLDGNCVAAHSQLAIALKCLGTQHPQSAGDPSKEGRRIVRVGRHAFICCGPSARIRIGENVYMPPAEEDPALFNAHAGNIDIGDWCLLAYGLQIHTGTHDPDTIDQARHYGPSSGRDVTLGRGVWTGARVTILGPSNIGDHAVIGACSLVTGDVPAGEIWAGNPAKFVRRIDVRRDEPAAPHAIQNLPTT